MDKSGNPVLEEKSDQGLHCLLFHMDHSEVSHHGRTSNFDFLSVNSKVIECPEI